MKIYLCGPINGCTDGECKDWREAAKPVLPDTLDPMRRDYRGREDQCVPEIVEGDKADIDQCDALLVNYDKPSVGTSMEILYAWERGIPVIVVAAKGARISPWLRYHSKHVLNSFAEAFDLLKNYP
jgi:nucleoside 2-deoxyribosyltransferase